MKYEKINKIKKKFLFSCFYTFLVFLNKIFLLTIDKFCIKKNLYLIFLREDRVGHQGNADTEFFKASKRAKYNNSRTIFIFPYPEYKVANKFLRYKLIEYAKLEFYKVKVINYKYVNEYLTDLILYSISVVFKSCNNIYFAHNECGPRLSKNIFRNLKINNNLYKSLGIKSNNFVCIYARDSKFLESFDKNINFDYHNFRDSKIDNLKLLSQFISKNLGWDVLRIGSDPRKKISWERSGNSKIIDYSFSGLRNEKNDVDLLANCRLFIGNGGPASIAIGARREMIRINQVPIGTDCGYNYGLWIPKLHYINESEKYLSLIEICERGLGNVHSGDYFEKSNIILKENTPEEILNIFKDYLKFKKDCFSKNEKLIIKKYQTIRKKIHNKWNILEYNKNFISPSFLIKYENLLKD